MFLSSLLALALASQAQAQGSVLSIHGSGTTNPSKCYWHIMDKMEARSKLPMHMTYRGIGSSSGQAEFANDQKITYFGSGDIPLKEELYSQLSSTETVLQLPVFVGAVSFFHNVPNAPTLNMTACTLAKVMMRDITNWNDDEITKDNPELTLPSGGLAIRVARRVDGSSSTSGITNYLAKACPDVWAEDNTGSTVDWPADTLECQGSGGVVNCIEEEPGTIGYLDAGHGHGAGLEEVSLENRDGTKLTTVQSRARGGIAGAADAEGLLPDGPTDDFSDVSLIWQPGEFTWPIAAMTYIYVRQDLSFIPVAQEQALLKAFLQTLYDDSFVQQCVDAYEFAKVEGKALDIASEAISMLQVDSSAVPFEFEQSTMLQEGQGDYIISAKRKSSTEIDVDVLTTANEQLKAEVTELRALVNELQSSVNALADQQADMPTTNGGGKSRSALLPYQTLWLAGAFVASLAYLSHLLA